MGTADIDLKQRSGITVEESAYEHHLDSGVETEDLSTTTSGSSSTASFSRSGSMDSLLSDDDEDDNRLSSFSSKTRRHHNANSSSSGATDVNSNGDDGDGLRYAVLCHEQVRRLDRVMHEVIPIDGRGNFPTLEIQLRDLVQLVRAKLERDDIHVRDIRLNGGCASYVLSSDDSQPYNDLDLIFAVDLSSHKNYEKVKQAVLSSLLDFMPEKVNKKRITSCSLKEAYVHKMVKVPSEGDRWSLISLSNSLGRNIELKFVDTMKRQFEFSVDSFQIILDSLLLFHECAAMPMSETFYPSVVGESVYGNFQEALYHLNCKLISTRHPEEIRGGGLLKYCDLLVRDYQAANVDEIKTLERYMCSRFFIDFSDINHQRTKLENYLVNHFIGGDELSKYDYLTTLHRVVNDSTVCLMGHERRQTLSLIEELACRVYFQEQQMVMSKQPFQFQQFELVSVGHPSSGSSNGANGSYTTTNQPIQFIFGAQPNNGSQPAAGYFVTPFMTSPMPSNQQTFQQQQQQQPCTCSWMPCT